MSDHFEPADYSVIVPIGGRFGDLGTLYRDYRAAMAALGGRTEFIFVFDGPNPGAGTHIETLLRQGERITVIELTRSFGESTALMAGFQRANAPIIVTLPAYDQIEAREIPKLVQALDEVDLAVAHRWPRAGSAWELFRRNAFHGIIAKVTGLKYRDLGCSARAFRRRVLEEISLYGDQHRFLPVLANRQGFRVSEVDLRQSPRDRFQGSYKARDYVRRALDIFSVFFLVRFTKRPLRFFGMVGAITFSIGALLTAWLVIERLFLGQSLADRPALLLSSLAVVLGLQLFALGLLGELIIFTHAREMKDYKVDRIVESVPTEAARLATPAAATPATVNSETRTDIIRPIAS
jgi:glycosyltransferase involved in cell wall biosynthesis